MNSFQMKKCKRYNRHERIYFSFKGTRNKRFRLRNIKYFYCKKLTKTVTKKENQFDCNGENTRK